MIVSDAPFVSVSGGANQINEYICDDLGVISDGSGSVDTDARVFGQVSGTFGGGYVSLDDWLVIDFQSSELWKRDITGYVHIPELTMNASLDEDYAAGGSYVTHWCLMTLTAHLITDEFDLTTVTEAGITQSSIWGAEIVHFQKHYDRSIGLAGSYYSVLSPVFDFASSASSPLYGILFKAVWTKSGSWAGSITMSNQITDDNISILEFVI